MVFGPGAHYKCFFIKSNIHKKFNSENTIRPTKVSKPGTEPDQDQEKFRNMGLNRTRPRKISKPRTGPDQDQQNFETSDQTGPEPRKTSKPGGPWIPVPIEVYSYACTLGLAK